MNFKVASLVAAVVLSATFAQAKEWTGYTYPAVSTTEAVKGMERICQRVATETGGKLKITLHLGKTLKIASSDITQAAGDGAVDFAEDFFFSGSVPPEIGNETGRERVGLYV